MGDRVLRTGKNGRAEQRFIIKFFASQGDTPIRIWTWLRAVHGVNTLLQQAVRNWTCRFREDPAASCLDKPRSSGPCTAWNAGTITKVRCLVTEDSCRTVHELALLSHVSVGSMHRILRSDLKYKKITA